MPKLHGQPRVFTRRGIARPPYNPALEKYFHQRRNLFSKYDCGCALDAEGWYSATPEAAAAITAQIMETDGASRGSIFVDAFVGTGSNAIQQALHDPAGVVIAIDIDPAKIAMARHNAAIYGVAARIHFVIGDFASLAPRLRAHAVFLSPPWGGPEYGASDTGGFRIASIRCGSADDADGYRLFELAATIAPTVAYYLPVSTAEEDILALTARHASQRCECVHLAWGGEKKRRPRAVLACFHGPRLPSHLALSPPGLLHSTANCDARSEPSQRTWAR
eukprot:jgi/Chrpa1/11010/Chrysochromulina_OHIO_Genome00007041-RA